jgi:hypothetical protein
MRAGRETPSLDEGPEASGGVPERRRPNAGMIATEDGGDRTA